MHTMKTTLIMVLYPCIKRMDLKCAGKLKDVLFAEKSYDSYTIQLVAKQFYRKVFDVRRNL